MKGEWCYFKSYFDKQTCEDILKKAQEIPAQDAYMGIGANPSSNSNVRRSKIRFVNNGDWRFQKLFDDLWRTALQANADFFNFHLTKLDFIQIAEYDSSYLGEYKEHKDVFWINDDPFYHRKLTCVIQLSDPLLYEGGNLEITDSIHTPDANELRQQGTVIFFPSFMMHRANPVTKGTRHSIAAWFEGPKWR